MHLSFAALTKLLGFATRVLITASRLPKKSPMVQLLHLDLANACPVFSIQPKCSWKPCQTALPSRLLGHGSYSLYQFSVLDTSLAGPEITRSGSLTPKMSSGNVRRAVSVALMRWWEPAAGWHSTSQLLLLLPATGDSSFVLPQPMCPPLSSIRPHPLSAPVPLVSRIAGLLGCPALCKLTTFGSVTIPMRPPSGRAHTVSWGSRTLC